MPSVVTPCQVPDFSLLKSYRAPAQPQCWEQFQDCFVVDVPRAVSLADYIDAFYSSLPFRLERRLIQWLIGKGSSAEDVRALAAGRSESFSAWLVLARTENQILLGDFQNNTRSWLAVLPQGNGQVTRLHFGSGIRSVRDPETGEPTMSWGFRVLGGFHILYSKILLAAARRGLLNETHRSR